ncbi:MAG: ABC transporter permease subunit [Bacillota bacterium]|nr:MAG: sugar ABC transporter permease [Bacillota bacterium]
MQVFPVGYTIYVAFTNYNLNNFANPRFIGLENFREIITGRLLREMAPAFGWTITFAVLGTLLAFSVGLVLAVLLSNPFLREGAIYRGILILPWALPGTVAILAWSGLLNDGYGQINGLLTRLFGPEAAVPWLTDPTMAKVSVLLVNTWLGFPFMMSLCLGALQSIPPELYEAAEIDGAGSWKQFWHITLPILTSFSLPLLISTFSYNFNNFGAVFLLTGGGPPVPGRTYAGATDLLISVAYKLTQQYFQWGLGAATSIILFFIVGTLSLLQFKLSGTFKEVR